MGEKFEIESRFWSSDKSAFFVDGWSVGRIFSRCDRRCTPYHSRADLPLWNTLVSLSAWICAKFGFHVASKTPIQLEPKLRCLVGSSDSASLWNWSAICAESGFANLSHELMADTNRDDGTLNSSLHNVNLHLQSCWKFRRCFSVHFKSLQKDGVASILRMICREMNVRNEVNSC